ncbi:MAG: hypothetical protein QOI26_1854 [Pseudonocardiales bacterium]|nr:hypothetical protein [Pseudonocardiales bacterium]
MHVIAGRCRPLGAASTPRLDRCDISDQRDSEHSAEPADSHDPTEKIDSAEPTLPTEANEPTLPMDNIEPFDPMDSRLSCDHNDQREPELFISPAWQAAGGVNTS